MGTHLKIPFLQHYFSNYDPCKDRNLAASTTAFHLRDFESSDYRSAYVQLTDWFYGWNVSDATDYSESQYGAELFKAKRVPRSIDMASEVERSEVDRILKTFITLFAISRRTLRKYHIEIEEKMPRLGHGLDTFKVNKGGNKQSGGQKTPGSDEAGDLLLNKEDLWAQNVVEESEMSESESQESLASNHEKKEEEQSKNGQKRIRRGSQIVVRKRRESELQHSKNGRRKSSSVERKKSVGKEQADVTTDKGEAAIKLAENTVISDLIPALPSLSVGDECTIGAPKGEPILTHNKELKNERLAYPVSGSETELTSISEASEMISTPRSPPSNDSGSSQSGAESIKTSSRSSTENLKSDVATSTSSDRPGLDTPSVTPPTDASVSMVPVSKSSATAFRVGASPSISSPGKNMIEMRSASFAGFNFMAKKRLRKKDVENSDMAQLLRADINHIYNDVDKSTDYTLLCISISILILGFAELENDQKLFTQYLTYLHEISAEFISNTLKTVWDLLHQELPEEDLTFSDLRDPEKLRICLKEIIEVRLLTNSSFLGLTKLDDGVMENVDDKNPAVMKEFPWMKLYRKFALVHMLLTSVDIHVLPTFISAHKTGVKCCQSSSFDSSIWLTGGYDSAIRIHDIRSKQCLGQFIGHKSIVTDLCFTKNDTFIVSCSFDRTVKIWNSQSAQCERTMVGHTDFVISCDISPDGRYIVSGSTDNSLKLWEFASGDCLATIKKHSRWVKVVRFSPDGKYFASGGLDKKIFLWDTKHVVNSKTVITHSRCIEAHGDYILDLALGRPSLLLSASRDQTVKLFDYITGQELYTIKLAPSWARSLSFSFDMEYFATGSFDNNVNIFKTKTGERVRHLRVFNMGILCVKWPGRHDGFDYLVCGSEEGFFQKITLCSQLPII